MGVNQKINLSLDDLLDNIISYGYRDKKVHQIALEFRLLEKEIIVVVKDDAVAFNPFNGDGVDTSLSIDDRDIGGLGIHLIKQLMSSYKYVRKSNENLVTLTMNLAKN